MNDSSKSPPESETHMVKIRYRVISNEIRSEVQRPGMNNIDGPNHFSQIGLPFLRLTI